MKKHKFIDVPTRQFVYIKINYSFCSYWFFLEIGHVYDQLWDQSELWACKSKQNAQRGSHWGINLSPFERPCPTMTSKMQLLRNIQLGLHWISCRNSSDEQLFRILLKFTFREFSRIFTFVLLKKFRHRYIVYSPTKRKCNFSQSWGHGAKAGREMWDSGQVLYGDS